MSPRLIRWTLAALLVLGQSALLLHLSDIDAHASDSGSCNVCLLAHGLNTAIPSDPVSVYFPDQAATPVTGMQQARCCQPVAGLYRTRAPPQHTSAS